MDANKVLTAFVFAILLPALPARAQQSDSLSRDQRWRDDLHYLTEQLPKLHKNAFAFTTKSAFDSAAKSIDARIPALQDEQIALEFSRLVGMLHESHTGIRIGAMARQFRMLPVTFMWGDDGIFLVAVDSAHADLAGLRVTTINGVKAEVAARRAAAFTSTDNEATLREAAPSLLMIEQVLQAAGLAEKDKPVTITVQAKEGPRSFTVSARPLMARGRLMSPLESAPRPLYLSNTSAAYWYKVIDPQTVYFAYMRCVEDPAKPLADFARDLLATIDSVKPQKIIVDLRMNGGGNSDLLSPILAGIKHWKDGTAGAQLFALTGARTFSSAVINAVQLKRIGATIVGQPTGGRPNHYGEVRTFQLPNSKLTVNYSTKFFEMVPGLSDESLMPDIAVPAAIMNLLAGRDAVLERIQR